jgi:hypothetical protein
MFENLVFIPNKEKKKKFPKVAEDGKVMSDVSPYYVYVCANPNCGCCGWQHLWVDKQDNHKCTICGKTMIRAANPKQVQKEDYS